MEEEDEQGRRVTSEDIGHEEYVEHGVSLWHLPAEVMVMKGCW
jgi:hypothetical protein